MSIITFQITLNHPQEIFYSGQEVSGFLTLRTTKEKRMRGIEIKFHGEAYVHWTESRSSTDSEGKSTTETDSYSNTEVYFTQYFYVVGGQDHDMTLPPGDYSYPFRFILPPNLPPSFEGLHGHIRYTVRGRVNRPWRFDHKCKRVFTVLRPLDLNSQPGIQEPCQRSIEKVLCCGCCASEAMTFVVNLPNRGFVPGQKPGAVAELDNPTNERIGLKCQLIQKIIYKSSCGRTNEHENTIETEVLGYLEGRGSMTRRSSLQIPPVPPSLWTLCRCINIEYTFRVRGSLSGMHRDALLDVPIIVGTIPLRTHFPFITPAEPSVPALMPLAPSAPPGDAPPTTPPAYSMYPEMPPPTYEECMSGKANIRSEEDDEYVQGDMEFAPRYPMYRFK